MIDLQRVLVATDFGPASDAALRYGRELASRLGASLTVLHVVDDMYMRVSISASGFGYLTELTTIQRDTEEAAQRNLKALFSGEEQAALHARTELIVSNTPATAIVEFAAHDRADLIIIGTNGRTGAARFFIGSVAERVVRTAACPVLVIHHPEREFVLPDTPTQRVSAA